MIRRLFEEETDEEHDYFEDDFEYNDDFQEEW
jgi:hypothetical protein